MKTIESSARQTLEDFKKMMKEIKPYLPPRMRIIDPKPQPYRLTNVRESRYNY